MSEPYNQKQLHAEYQQFLLSRLSINLATTNQEGNNEASFAPFIWHQECVYIYLSSLARHYQNLILNPDLGLLLIEDESSSSNPFSRERIQMQGRAEMLARDSPVHLDVLPVFREKFGKTFELIEQLTDFNSFRLQIRTIRYIKGFARAYDLVDNEFRHIGSPNPDNLVPPEEK